MLRAFGIQGLLSYHQTRGRKMAQGQVREYRPELVEQKPEERKPQRPSSPPPAEPRSRRPLVLAAISVVVLAAIGFTVWKIFFAVPPTPKNIVILSGRIEGDDSAVSPKAGGRILEIRYREGDSVNAGDTIAVLIDEQLKAREAQGMAAW